MPGLIFNMTILLASVGLWLAVLLHLQVPSSVVPKDPIVQGIGFEAAWRKSERALAPGDLTDDANRPPGFSNVQSDAYRWTNAKFNQRDEYFTVGLDYTHLARAPPANNASGFLFRGQLGVSAWTICAFGWCSRFSSASRPTRSS